MPISILLVDDDKNILTSVTMLLETEGFQVTTYSDGASALSALNRSSFDLAVLDIKMPRMDGIELLKHIRRRSTLPVIFLTSKDTELNEAEGFMYGADDYITKPFSQELLIRRIRAVLRRTDPERFAEGYDRLDKTYFRGDLHLDPERYICSWKNKDIPVTVTEFLILESLVKHTGHVKTRDALMDVAYNEDVYVDDRTIDSHIKRLRKKFRDMDPLFDSIKTLYGVGYKWTQ